MAVLDHPRATRSTSPALVIEVRPTGTSVPKYGGADPIPLTAGDLQVIEALVAGETLPDTGGSRTVEDLIGLLDDRGLLIGSRLRQAPSTPKADTTPPFGSPPDEVLLLPTPTLLAVGTAGFEMVDHEGRVLALLSAEELVAAMAFRVPTGVADARQTYAAEAGPAPLNDVEFDALVTRLFATGMLVVFDPDSPVHATQTRQAERMREGIRRQALVHQEFDRIETGHDAERDRTGLVRVIGVHTNYAGPPQSLGLLLAAALEHDDGALEENYDFRPRLLWDRPRLEAAAGSDPAIFLFSNYLWSTDENLALSELVKRVDHRNVTLHGGPNTPKYAHDAEKWFERHPHVDVCVHGEGEDTFVELLTALRGAVGSDPIDLSVLAGVAGLTFRTADGIVQTGSRDRIADIDSIPSPVLTGLFDGFIPAGGGDAGLVLETNRGCPYGCTFCDWGSATLSRIRKFDLDRVLGEIEWCAVHGFGIGLADANFGIFERDVEIAEKIADLKAEHGYPRVVGNNYAKNTVKHLSKIIEIFTEAGITAEGKMSMQTFDETTLHTIKRKNIKVEKYTDLSVEFRRNELPLVVELMMGLPGARPESFQKDLQACIDRDVRAAVYPTVLLPNSPMNDPEYREANAIVAVPGEVVRDTASYTPDEYDQMEQLRLCFYVFENFGVLRQVAKFVRSQTGIHEIEFYRRFSADVLAEPQLWPSAAVAIEVIPHMMVPPVSWSRFIADVRRYLVDSLGMADDSALDTVLRVQHALLPSRDRTFPAVVELAHDYPRWHAMVAEQRAQGHFETWHEHIPTLAELPPVTFEVTDPLRTCESAFGYPCDSFLYYENSWDLTSSVSRPRQATPTVAV